MASPTFIFTAIIFILSIIIIYWLLEYKNTPTPGESQVRITSHALIIYVAILFASILLWRGATNLMDDYFFPDHGLASSGLCVLIGVIILAIAISVAPSAILTNNT